MNKHILTLSGPSGCGKSTLERLLYKTNKFYKIVSFTTRNKRDSEVEGVDYYFISDDNYKTAKEHGLVAQETHFNNITYGSFYSEFQYAFDNNLTPIIVVVPSSITQIEDISNNIGGVDVYKVFLTNTKQVLLDRLLSRENIYKNKDYYISRIISLFDSEIKWGDEAIWDMVIESFNKYNEDEIIADLLNKLLH